MFAFSTRVSLPAVVLALPTVMLGQSALPENYSLQCWLNRSESLFIYENTQEVWYTSFIRTQAPLSLSKFTLLRCPNCVEFAGTFGGREYSGFTSTVQLENGEAAINLTLEIDGQPQHEIYCERKN